MNVAADGFFTKILSWNARSEIVYPYLKSKNGQPGRGFDVSITGKKSDYRLMSLDEFLDFIARAT